MTTITLILTLAATVLVAAALAFFITRSIIRQSTVPINEAEATKTALAAAEATKAALEIQLQQAGQMWQETKSKLDEKMKELIAVSNEAARRKAELDTLSLQLQTLQIEKQELTTKMDGWQKQYHQTALAFTSLKSQQEAAQQRLNEQQQTMANYGEQLRKEFQVLADAVLAAKAAQFNQQQESKLADILNPVRIKLEEFKLDIGQKFSTASTERTRLEEQVKQMAALNQKLSQQAENLTKALSSQVKQQGNWGEEILETILQHVGLEKGIHYLPQYTGVNEDGQTIRPDFVIRYPDNRYVIIDSKVSLVHYQRFTETDIKEEQTTNLNLLVRSVKQHIDGLAGKQYQHINGTLDYVLLFIPVEGAFIAALQAEHSLWKYAFDKKIMLVSPTLLLSAMKLIHELWKQDGVNKNAAQIADRAGKLYDKLVSFVDSFESIGKKIDDAAKSFTQAKGQLFTGKGNALAQAEQLKKLGAKTSIEKQLKGMEEWEDE